MSLLRVDLPGFLILVTLFFNCRAYAFIADARSFVLRDPYCHTNAICVSEAR